MSAHRLTPRQAQCAALAARGLTNREIGAELGLTRKTVGHYLEAAYVRLGVAGRRELNPRLLPEVEP